MVFCEKSYCIYWLHGVCTLDEVTLGTLGQCNSCILVDIDEDIIERAKKKRIQIFETEDFDW